MTAVGRHGAYTLCFAGGWNRQWGFFVDDRLVPWRDYIKSYRSRRADQSSAATKSGRSRAPAQAP
jgi:hypothetical protein